MRFLKELQPLVQGVSPQALSVPQMREDMRKGAVRGLRLEHLLQLDAFFRHTCRRRHGSLQRNRPRVLGGARVACCLHGSLQRLRMLLQLLFSRGLHAAVHNLSWPHTGRGHCLLLETTVG